MEDSIDMLTQKAKEIKLNPVLSSNIAGVGYNYSERILVVLFKGGNKYFYYNVEPEIYETIITSDSIGKALNECVVRNKEKYKYCKLPQEVKSNEG